MSEKWEIKEWVLFENSESRLKKWRQLNKGKIKIENDKILIGKHEIEYRIIDSVNIQGVERLIINSKDGNQYKLHMFSSRGLSEATKTLYSILADKLEHYNKESFTNTFNFIKDLPKLYRDISFENLTSRTGLDKLTLTNIIEQMILNGELKAKIRENMIIFERESDIISTPPSYELNKLSVQDLVKREGMSIFVSYATKDAELYKIPEIARGLESYKEIGEVLYWQEDMHDSIIEYMNDNLRRSDVVLLFCSPNALDSEPVKKEWMAAEAAKKPIIPIFLKPEHIPILLADRLGVEFDSFDLQKNLQHIYELALKKT